MLEEFLHRELTAIPVEHWRDCFPAQVALMRFLQAIYPDKVELSRAGVDEDGPYLAGRGVAWFGDYLWNDELVLEAVDQIMTATVLELKERYPEGIEYAPDVPLHSESVKQLEEMVLQRTDACIRDGSL
jgi:hypothetical protein